MFQNLYSSLFSCVNSTVLQHGSISLFTSVNVQRRHIAFSMFTSTSQHLNLHHLASWFLLIWRFVVLAIA